MVIEKKQNKNPSEKYKNNFNFFQYHWNNTFKLFKLEKNKVKRMHETI